LHHIAPADRFVFEIMSGHPANYLGVYAAAPGMSARIHLTRMGKERKL
jgi:hypothetical protein